MSPTDQAIVEAHDKAAALKQAAQDAYWAYDAAFKRFKALLAEHYPNGGCRITLDEAQP